MSYGVQVFLLTTVVAFVACQIVHIPPVYNVGDKQNGTPSFQPYEVPDLEELLRKAKLRIEALNKNKPTDQQHDIKITSVNVVEPGQNLSSNTDFKLSLDDLSLPPFLFSPVKIPTKKQLKPLNPATTSSPLSISPIKFNKTPQATKPFKSSLVIPPTASVSFNQEFGARIPKPNNKQDIKPPQRIKPQKHFQIATLSAPHHKSPEFPVSEGIATSSVSFSRQTFHKDQI